MKTDSFAEQYKHPKWQKKRLEVLEQSGYECNYCGDTDTELQVHHIEYLRGKKVWEYNDDNFITLCKPCHEKVTELLTDTKRKLGNAAYFYTLTSLSLAWRTGKEEEIGWILDLLAKYPEMFDSIFRLLLTIDQKFNASETPKTGTEG